MMLLMSKQWKQSKLYQGKYPHYLPWHKAIWITKENDIVFIDGKKYKVTKAELSSELGSLPKITVEEIIDE